MPGTTTVQSPDRRRPSAARQISPFNYRVDDWTILTGASVEIRKNGAVVRRGRVENTTPDGGILWLSCGQGESHEGCSKRPRDSKCGAARSRRLCCTRLAAPGHADRLVHSAVTGDAAHLRGAEPEEANDPG
jgi:hypothetical protein